MYILLFWRIGGHSSVADSGGALGASAPPSNKSSTYLNIRHTTIRFSKTLNQMNRFDLCDDSKTKYK